MNELQIFTKEGFGQIRTKMYRGMPYFAGIDVARGLEYAKPSQAVIDHCKGIRKLGIPSEGGIQETNMIPIGDVCRLIVKAATQSKNLNIKEIAETYEAWIFDEIMPAIHLNGGYSLKGNDITVLTAATGYIREMRHLMRDQGSTPQEIARLAELVCRRYGLPLPDGFVKEPPFNQLQSPNFKKFDDCKRVTHFKTFSELRSERFKVRLV